MRDATSITRSHIGAVRTNPASRAHLLELMTVVTALKQRLGVRLDSSLPVDRLEFCDGLPYRAGWRQARRRRPELVSSVQHVGPRQDLASGVAGCRQNAEWSRPGR
jgi:hypothetical protein